MAETKNVIAFEFGEATELPARTLPPAEFVRFELGPKDTVINLRLPAAMLDAIRARAKQKGVPCQRFVRIALERMLRNESL